MENSVKIGEIHLSVDTQHFAEDNKNNVEHSIIFGSSITTIQYDLMTLEKATQILQDHFIHRNISIYFDSDLDFEIIERAHREIININYKLSIVVRYSSTHARKFSCSLSVMWGWWSCPVTIKISN